MLTLGCDPEFFLVDKNGDFIPAMDTVGGSKECPRVLPSGHTVQEDGCAVEIGIIPARTKEEWKRHIKEALNDVKAILKPLKLSPMFVPKAEFKEKYMEDARAWRIGCDPDVDVYSQEVRTMSNYTDTVRYAGGHIHIGSPLLLDPNNIDDYVKALDVTVGYQCALKEANHDRAKVYGGPGKFRYKPYGIEYRSPSNVWLVDVSLQNAIYDNCLALHRRMENRTLFDYSHSADVYRHHVLDAMLTGNKQDALSRLIRYL